MTKKKIFFVLIFFIILEMIMTYPLIFKINSHIPGFFSTDEPYSVLWNAWFTKYSLKHDLSIKKTDFLAYPFGIDFFTNKPINYLWFLINYSYSILTNPALTYNLQIIFNFLCAALFTFLVVYQLTKNAFSSFLSGIVFSFCPYLFVRSWQHLGETYLWTMPFALWGLFLLKDKLSNGRKTLFILGLVLTTIGFNFYYVGIILFTFFVYFFLNYLRNNSFKKKNEMSFIKNVIFLGFFAFLILLFQFLPVVKGIINASSSIASAQNPYRRPFEDLFLYSAKPLSYFLPPAVHPIFGKFTEQFIGSPFYGVSFTEHALFLGWVPLILAFIAVRRYWKNKKLLTPNSELRTNEDFYIGFFIFLAIAAWFFSQPPWWKIGQFKIYLPSLFMYKLLPMFRAYCRFGIVVMLAVAVLAGFGLKFILDKFKTQKTKIIITSIFCGLILFEFWNYPPFKVIDVSKVPQVYYWLKQQPKDIVIAEYPLDDKGPNEMYKFYQTKHEKKIINATIPATYANKVTKAIIKLSDPYSAGILKWLGVKFVLVHREDYLRSELVEQHDELNKIPKNPGLKLVKNFPSQVCPQKDIMCVQKTGIIDVYEVIAKPIRPEAKE
ncbi:MAG: hypothetical protein Q8O13_07255 [Candidatus Omnitrophota bacterium]|nr:hypothetical protein [Candidatus Omnitrophota bacterium]